MKILSYNPGHDGAIAYLENGRLVFSIEAEKNSGYRYSPISVPDFFDVAGMIDGTPEVVCRGGWWPSDQSIFEQSCNAGYHGVPESGVIVKNGTLFGKSIKKFSSSHERSHLLCSYGMSDLPMGTPCYALLWEGVIGAFYEIDHNLRIKKLAEVLPEPGHRYALLFGIADPTFDLTSAEYSRFSDAGKLMALASYSNRNESTREEERIVDFLLQNCTHLKAAQCLELCDTRYYNVGLEDAEFRNFAGIFSDRIFERFRSYAESNLRRDLPLLISGGCGLNCDWNTKWRESNLFSDVFVPPVANDSGSAIGTAIDAQLHFTGDPKIEWNVYSGHEFESYSEFDASSFDIFKSTCKDIANLLVNDLIFGWVNGRCEIGPRALGNRSIIAAPFSAETRIRLNEIKQREQYRPIAPVCLERDAKEWFGCERPSPYMLYTQVANTDDLEAVTHVNRTARIQTVSHESNNKMFELLSEFRALTGFGVLCNTSLNFIGRGFINNIIDLAKYTTDHELDGFVIDDRCYLLKSSKRYQDFLKNHPDFLESSQARNLG